MSKIWTEEEVEQLIYLVKLGKSKEYLKEYFNRTDTAIEHKVNRLGLRLERDYKRWTSKEVESFKRDWLDSSLSKVALVKKYNRPYSSLGSKALKLNLGKRPYDTEYLSISTISEEMNVSYDRVSNWLHKGLKYKETKNGKTKYLIKIDDLLEFLEKNKNLYNASRISNYLFMEEPEWLLRKRREDKEYFADKLRLKYTKEEDKLIVSLYELGKSNEYIAKKLKKNDKAIKIRLKALGCI